MTDVTDAITALLRDRHELAATDTADFSGLQPDPAARRRIVDQRDADAAARRDRLDLAVVGGIGIMNIMLVSVRERTREIGIRKAVGARGRDILAQFLIEALTLSLLGGLIGIVLGLGVSALIGQLAGWGFQFDPSTVVAAVAVQPRVGVVFGVWPARQAARLDPIIALRYE